MKRFLVCVAAMTLTLATNARIVEHTIDRGETIESIAKTYGVSTISILKENPEMKDMFFAGMVIKIPIAEQKEEDPTQTQSTQSDTQYSTKHNILTTQVNNVDVSTDDNRGYKGTQQTCSYSEAQLTFDDFSSFYLSYNAQFNHFDKGCYGIGYLMSLGNLKHWGLGFAIEANYGIVNKDASIMLDISAYYGIPINKYFMPYLKLTGYWIPSQETVVGTSTYNSGKVQEIKRSAMGGGMHLAPGVAIKIKPFVIYVGYELGFCSYEAATGKQKIETGQYVTKITRKLKTETGFLHRFTLSLGFNFR